VTWAPVCLEPVGDDVVHDPQQERADVGCEQESAEQSDMVECSLREGMPNTTEAGAC
jgi:hypothetical protein